MSMRRQWRALRDFVFMASRSVPEVFEYLIRALNDIGRVHDFAVSDDIQGVVAILWCADTRLEH